MRRNLSAHLVQSYNFIGNISKFRNGKGHSVHALGARPKHTPPLLPLSRAVLSHLRKGKGRFQADYAVEARAGKCSAATAGHLESSCRTLSAQKAE